MNYEKFFIVLLFSLLFISCNNNTEPEPIINNNYPIASNNEWEYNTTDTIEYYDTLGNIKNTEVHNLGNMIVRIEALKDTLDDSFKNLIRFVSFDVGQSNKKL